jgi:hypothetical protein
MKQLMTNRQKITKKEQRHITGGARRLCSAYCPDFVRIRCYYYHTCIVDTVNCCVFCDDEPVCA